MKRRDRRSDMHRRLEHAVTLAALNRPAGRKAPSLFPEGSCVPQPVLNDSGALIRACLGILRAHRDELDELREQLAEIRREAVA